MKKELILILGIFLILPLIIASDYGYDSNNQGTSTVTGGGSTTIIINGSASGTCPAGYAVQNVTATTIECILMPTGNASWTQAQADTLYYSLTNPNNYVNGSYYPTYDTYNKSEVDNNFSLFAKYNFTDNNFNGSGNITTPAIDTGNRILYDVFGYATLNWYSYRFHDDADVESIDWSNRNLMDTSGVGMMNWGNMNSGTLFYNWNITGNLTIQGNYICNSTGTCYNLNVLNQTGSGGGNASWNESYAYTLFLNRTSESLYITTYNATYNTLLNQNCPVGQVVNGTYINGTFKCVVQSAGNSSWNQSYANTLYYSITNPKNYINQTQSDALYYPITNPDAYTNESYWGKNGTYLYTKGNENVYAPRFEAGSTNRLFDVIGFFKSNDALFTCTGTLEGCENLTGNSSCNNVSGCNWEQSISCGNDPQLNCDVYNEGECLAKNQSFCSPTYNAACAGTRDCTIQSGDKGWCDTHTDLCTSSGAGCTSSGYCEGIGNDIDCGNAGCFWNGASCEPSSSCTGQSTSSGCGGITGCSWSFACTDYAGRYCTDGWSQSTCSQYTSIGCYWNDGFNICDETFGTGSCPNIPVDVCLDYNGCNLTGSEEFSCLGSILDTSCGQLGQADCTSENTTGYCSTQIANNTETLTAQAGVGQTNDTYRCLDSTGNKNWYSDYQCGLFSNTMTVGDLTVNNIIINGTQGLTISLNMTSANATECYQNFTGGLLTYTNCLTYQ